MSRSAAWTLALLAACSAALAACGGGVFLSFGSVFGDNGTAPDVSLAASSARVAPGQSLRLVAAASDDVGIDSVAFYRADANADTLLGADGAAPYQWDAQVPLDAFGSLEFFAIATDVEGQRTRSAPVTVEVLR